MMLLLLLLLLLLLPLLLQPRPGAAQRGETRPRRSRASPARERRCP
jgi:hypothetical protein